MNVRFRSLRSPSHSLTWLLGFLLIGWLAIFGLMYLFLRLQVTHVAADIRGHENEIRLYERRLADVRSQVAREEDPVRLRSHARDMGLVLGAPNPVQIVRLDRSRRPAGEENAAFVTYRY